MKVELSIIKIIFDYIFKNIVLLVFFFTVFKSYPLFSIFIKLEVYT